MSDEPLSGEAEAGDLPARVRALLAENHVMTLATSGPRGPWAAAVFFAVDGADLVFASSPRSRHATDLAADPRAAAAIHPECSEWREIRGVQLEGIVCSLDGPERARAMHAYGERFAFASAGAGVPAAIATALARVTWYALTPQRICLVDNARGFGRRDCYAPLTPARHSR